MEKGISYYDLAENDYQFLLKDWQEGRIGNLMCSAAQNICERYLKHVIDSYITDTDVTRILQTHSLKALRRFMQEHVPDFEGKWKIILQADGYYFSTRYPGDTAFFVGKEDVDECWEAVEETRRAVIQLIKEQKQRKMPIDQEGAV
ncbi:MAG TPA: HEPN domain-containing protein [Candidatus Blautia faecipullorum]|nr:HEPN domain-containing protein [Candidatus Blautia faecipullorum]